MSVSTANSRSSFTSVGDAEAARRTFVVDAENKVLGRLASKIAHVMMGKSRSTYSPHINDGDKVIVINAEKVQLTGKKWQQKTYYRHSGYVGGLKKTLYKDLLRKRPAFVLEKAVRGMLPKNRLGRALFSKNLRVYAGGNHPHEAQKPTPLEL